MRYTRQQHLRTAADFKKIRASGNRWECGFFYAHLQATAEAGEPLRRLGVIASRRIGNAVARNRAKRLLREVFRLNQDQLPAGCDLLLVARRPITRARYTDLERKFDAMVQRIVKPAPETR